MKATKLIAQIIGYCSLAGLALSSILFLTGSMELPQTKQYLMIATITWFLSSVYNMWKEKEPSNGNQ